MVTVYLFDFVFPSASPSVSFLFGFLVSSSRLRVQAADEFTRITSAVYNITFFCDLISVPWDRSIFHARLFNFSHSSWGLRSDQPILYNDEMRYCVYENTHFVPFGHSVSARCWVSLAPHCRSLAFANWTSPG
jgi:hypothetical protein